MGSVVYQLKKKGALHPPPFMDHAVQYETVMGSVAYGVSSNESDIDVYGFCIPPKEFLFPHLTGEIEGFGKKSPRFNQFQAHHIIDPINEKEYDINIYNIAKYFDLCMQNNPNMLDSLFTPNRCVLHITRVGVMIRKRRELFLSKKCFHKFKAYSYSMIHKMRNKKPEGKRIKIVEQYGFDVKFAYHLVRLLDECQQILINHDIDLERNREQLKAIRKGEVSQEDIEKLFSEKERYLEKLYIESSLREAPDVDEIRTLLLECLEEHYGSLDKEVPIPSKMGDLLGDMETLLYKYGRYSGMEYPE